MFASDYDRELCNARGLLIRDLSALRLVRAVKVATPVAGANFTQSVPAGVVWEVLTVCLRFTTSAAVANRSVAIQVVDQDGSEFGRYVHPTVQVASLNPLYTFAAGLGYVLDGTHKGVPLPTPPLILPSGWQLKGAVTNLDAGDAFTTVVATVREWAENAIADAVQYTAVTVAEQVAQRTTH